MDIKIPELSLVFLLGPSGAGKSTFARKHFRPTEVLSSDFCRAMISDDESDQSVTPDAFEILHIIAEKRLARGRRTVIDATNVQVKARKTLLALARKYHALPVAIVLKTPQETCFDRNRNRSDRHVASHIIRQQCRDLERSVSLLKTEGFRKIYLLETPDKADHAKIRPQPMQNDRKKEHGPFDIVGDIHGCSDELIALLAHLGYDIRGDADSSVASVTHPKGRKAVFLGDLVDRGPKTPSVLRLVMRMVETGRAFCVPGNHENRLMRKLTGRNVTTTHGLSHTLEQLKRESHTFQEKTLRFIRGLVSHYVFDKGNLVAVHAGMTAAMQGRDSDKVRRFVLYGETQGESDEYGLSVRQEWAFRYQGRAVVVYGHMPVTQAEWVNRTINIDTGCVFGGKLTALRYPEKEIVSIPANQTHYEPAPRKIRNPKSETNPKSE